MAPRKKLPPGQVESFIDAPAATGATRPLRKTQEDETALETKLVSSLEQIGNSMRMLAEAQGRLMTMQQEQQERLENLEKSRKTPVAIEAQVQHSEHIQGLISPKPDAGIKAEIASNQRNTQERLRAMPKRRLIVEEAWETIIGDVRVTYPKGVWMAPLEVADVYEKWRMSHFQARAFEQNLASAAGGMIPYNKLQSLLDNRSMAEDDWEGAA